MPFPSVCLKESYVCPSSWPVVRAGQNTIDQVEVGIHDSDGEPVPLSNAAVSAIAREAPWSSGEISLSVAPVPGEEGVVRLSLNTTTTRRAGLFLGQFKVVTSTSELLYPFYYEVFADLFNPSNVGCPSIAEVRLMIRDKCAEENYLLDAVEFADTEIAWALRRPVDYWNEALPPVSSGYTTATFPFRYNWLVGVVGELLSIAALNYERNRLSYSAAGTAVDDKDKGQIYMQLAGRYKDEFRQWVHMKKRSINMSQAFGSSSLRSFGR